MTDVTVVDRTMMEDCFDREVFVSDAIGVLTIGADDPVEAARQVHRAIHGLEEDDHDVVAIEGDVGNPTVLTRRQQGVETDRDLGPDDPVAVHLTGPFDPAGKAVPRIGVEFDDADMVEKLEDSRLRR